MDLSGLISEVTFKAVRSSGSGGQHVNKVSSKIELTFDVLNSNILSETHKNRLSESIKHRLTKEGVLILQCDESRSQHRNKELVVKRFMEIIERGLIVPKKRLPTKIPKAIIRKRLNNKSRQSDKKSGRKKPDLD